MRAVVLTVLWTPRVAAQADAPLRAAVDLVALDICVRAAGGHSVTGLGADDFLVIENGRPQRVQMFAVSRDVPIDAVLLVDRSASLGGEKDVQARTAARAFAATLRPADRFEVLGFDKRVSVLRDLAPLSAGIGLAAWREPRGETALFDALAVAAHRLAQRPRDPDRRRVLIVLSDGEDTSSILDEEAVLPALRRSGAVVYAVRLDSGGSGPVPWWLQRFATDTGGEATAVPKPEALPAWFTRISDEIRTLYRLGYVSSDARRDGTWRRVDVRVPTVMASVRTRTGYYAPSANDLPGRR